MIQKFCDIKMIVHSTKLIDFLKCFHSARLSKIYKLQAFKGIFNWSVLRKTF